MKAIKFFSVLFFFSVYLYGALCFGANRQNEFSEFDNSVWDLVYANKHLSPQESLTALSKLYALNSDLQPEQKALILMHQCRLAARTQQPLSEWIDQARALERHTIYAQGPAAKYRCEQELALSAADYTKYAELGHLAFASLSPNDSPAVKIWIAYDYIEQALEAGHYDKAIAAANMSLSIAQANSLLDWQAETLGRLALIQSAIGNREQALETNQQAMTLTTETKIQLELTVNRAYMLTEAHQYSAARELYESVLSKSLPDNPRYYLIAGTNLISIYLVLNDLTELAELLPTLSSMAASEQNDYLQAYVEIALAAEALLNSNPVQADKYFEQGKRWFTENQVFEPLAQILSRWASLLYSYGRYSEAYQALYESISIRDAFDSAKRTENALLNNAILSAEQQQRELLKIKQQHQQDQALLIQKKLEQRLSLTLMTAAILLSGISFYAYRRLNRANKQLAEKNLQLDYESSHDPLTKVFNRRYFSDFIAPKLASKSEALFLLLDIDHFKKVNDNFGHHAGDEVLKIVSQRLAGRLRENDRIIRWGGEEFLIFIDGPINEQQSEHIIRRLLQEIGGTPVRLSQQDIAVTVSIGFSVVNLDTMSQLEQTLDTIDKFLYHAKNNGRNQAVGFLQQGAPMNVLTNKNNSG